MPGPITSCHFAEVQFPTVIRRPGHTSCISRIAVARAPTDRRTAAPSSPAASSHYIRGRQSPSGGSDRPEHDRCRSASQTSQINTFAIGWPLSVNVDLPHASHTSSKSSSFHALHGSSFDKGTFAAFSAFRSVVCVLASRPGLYEDLRPSTRRSPCPRHVLNPRACRPWPGTRLLSSRTCKPRSASRTWTGLFSGCPAGILKRGRPCPPWLLRRRGVARRRARDCSLLSGAWARGRAPAMTRRRRRDAR